MAITTNIQPLLDDLSKLSDAEKLAMSQLIYKRYVEAANITTVNPIIGGVQCNTPIPKADRGNNWEYMQSTAGLTSQCDDVDDTITITYSTKLWNPVPYKASPEICYKDLACKVKDYFMSEGCSSGDATGTQWAEAVLSVIGENIVRSHWIKAWFGDTGATSTAFNAHDGLFVQMLAVATTGNTAQRYEIAENAEATKAAQLALGATAGLDVFQWMYDNQPDHLFGNSDLRIFATRTLCKNYLKWLQVNKQVECCERDPLTGVYNINNLSIYGIPIVMVKEWDEIILNVSEFDNGTVYDNPHRAVLTYSDNMPIGTCSVDELDNFDVRYDSYTEKTKFVTEYTIDAKVIEDADFLLAV